MASTAVNISQLSHVAEYIIKTLYGLEEVLEKELHRLGITRTERLNRAVKIEGSYEDMYRCNLHLRTALSVLKPIASFYAHHENQLYKKVRRIDWEAYLGLDQTFAISSTTNSPIFTHSKFAALKTKDAIVDQFRDKYGERPSVDTRHPDLLIDLHISDKLVTISLDSSGTTLDRRGYRTERTEAPLNEVLAAGLLALCEWLPDRPLLDPMCGSGTIVIEAAMMAAGMPPGAGRHFAFEKWPDFDREKWNQIRSEVKATSPPDNPLIFARDADPHALQLARQNARRAGVLEWIQFENENFFSAPAPLPGCMVVMNPPYGQRLHPGSMTDFYKKIGDTLKATYTGSEAWIISSNLKDLKYVGLRPSRKIKLFNGSLECRFQKYELYPGSRKGKGN
ncbi:MAG: RNA methyltransferase [Saprospiraceae bacterium]|nr:MAG: RNA methyltransferase [Saprospiraceae bacterium]